jgi:uncharacterized protein YjbJ (UPF0337 family)
MSASARFCCRSIEGGNSSLVHRRNGIDPLLSRANFAVANGTFPHLWRYFPISDWLAILRQGRLRRGILMDKDRIAGSAKVVKGKVKEAVGKAMGDAKLNAEGKADQVEGKVQNAVGGIKDAVKGN